MIKAISTCGLNKIKVSIFNNTIVMHNSSAAEYSVLNSVKYRLSDCFKNS